MAEHQRVQSRRRGTHPCTRERRPYRPPSGARSREIKAGDSMAGGATTTNLDDTFVAALFESRILLELRPALTSRSFIRWGPTGNSTAFSFSLLGDPGPSGAMTEGTDFTSVTDITTSKQTATASEVGILTTVSDVLIKVSLVDAMSTAAALLTRSTTEKWETDVAAIADNFG